VSAIICTRDRPIDLERAVRSVLANDTPPEELWIVDQSDGEEPHAMLSPYLDNPRVRYLRTHAVGLSSGRNQAMKSSSCEVLAFTDDDCEMRRDFIAAVASAFAVDPRIAIVYGNVLPAPREGTIGLIPTRVHPGARLIRTVWRASGSGMGACMALRRTAWESLGGFDERLGAGTPLEAAEEFDLTIRALLAGFYVYETDTVAVVHHGVRPRSAQAALVRSYYFGTGAALAKHLRCKPAPVALLAIRRALSWAFTDPPIDVGHPLRRGPRVIALLQGAIAGLRLPMDRERVLFER
jgi:GT2 family glycosyltransferase